MGRRCWPRRLLTAACFGAALLLLGAAPRALRPAFENGALGSGWFGWKRRSPLQMLYDLDQVARPLPRDASLRREPQYSPPVTGLQPTLGTEAPLQSRLYQRGN
ncbi:LOW QUALITY PROTEIN: hypothetical protein MC885_020087, partial [Smutsia gigantea]